MENMCNVVIVIAAAMAGLYFGYGFFARIGNSIKKACVRKRNEMNAQKNEQKKIIDRFDAIDKKLNEVFNVAKMTQSRVDQLHNRMSKDNATYGENLTMISNDIDGLYKMVRGVDGIYLGKDFVNRVWDEILKSDQTRESVKQIIAEEVKKEFEEN